MGDVIAPKDPIRRRQRASHRLHTSAIIAKRTRTWQRQIAASIAGARARRRPGMAG